MVPVEVTGEMITALVEQGGMDEANSSDLDYVGKAITAALRRVRGEAERLGFEGV